MKAKLKLCDGCGEMKVIWKNHQGDRYCQYCWNKKNTVTGKKTKPADRKPIAPRSPKRAKQEQEYSKVRKTFLLSYPTCQAKLPSRCTHEATQVHHKAGRIGSLLTDTRYFLAVCHQCHEWIELHPKEAKELGFSVNRLNIK